MPRASNKNIFQLDILEIERVYFHQRFTIASILACKVKKTNP